MRHCQVSTLAVLVMATCCWSQSGSGQQSTAQTLSADGTEEYLAGLDALETAQWPPAIAAFKQALARDPDSASYYTARGVAQALAEQLDAAEKDLTRARQLDPQSQEARLWLAVVVAMKGEFQRDVTIFPAAVNREVRSGDARAEADYQNLAREMSREYGQARWARQAEARGSNASSVIGGCGSGNRHMPTASW